jgi:hypothetical protein
MASEMERFKIRLPFFPKAWKVWEQKRYISNTGHELPLHDGVAHKMVEGKFYDQLGVEVPPVFGDKYQIRLKEFWDDFLKELRAGTCAIHISEGGEDEYFDTVEHTCFCGRDVIFKVRPNTSPNGTKECECGRCYKYRPNPNSEFTALVKMSEK